MPYFLSVGKRCQPSINIFEDTEKNQHNLIQKFDFSTRGRNRIPNMDSSDAPPISMPRYGETLPSAPEFRRYRQKEAHCVLRGSCFSARGRNRIQMWASQTPLHFLYLDKRKHRHPSDTFEDTGEKLQIAFVQFSRFSARGRNSIPKVPPSDAPNPTFYRSPRGTVALRAIVSEIRAKKRAKITKF